MTQLIIYAVTNDEKVLAALGRIAIAHAQMDNEHRMMLMRLRNLSLVQALRSTKSASSFDLRKEVRKLARTRFGEGEPLRLLAELLEKSADLTERRNEVTHSMWGYELNAGEPMIRGDGNVWAPAPTAEELETLAALIMKHRQDLLRAREQGFFSDALVATAAGTPSHHIPSRKGRSDQ